MNDSEPHRPPDDDLSYLGDLDLGLDLVPPHGETVARTPVARTPVVKTAAAKTPAAKMPDVAKTALPADRPPPRRRPLLDLFPPPSTPASIARAVARPQSTPPFSQGPAPVREVRPASVPPDREGLTYETFYGLREKPFSRQADSRFLYHSVAHDRASQELFVSIFRRDGLAVLTGDAGIGKTMLCRALLDRIDRRTFTSFVADPFVTLEDLLKTILFDFGVISRTDLGGGRLAEATRQELTFALHEFLLSLVQINGFAVVFIDDAHTLSPDMLEQVQGIADTDQALMGIVLIGQPELLPKLGPRKLSSGAERASVRARLDPLAEDEVAGYVLHRLTAGAAGRLRIEFSDAALALVYEISKGVPQLVNLLCNRALARGFEDSATLIDAPIVVSAARDLDLVAPEPITRKVLRRVLAAVALAGLVLLGAAAAALVFRAQLTRAIAGWVAVPTPPAGPVQQIVPVETPPPPVNESPTRRGIR